MPDQPEITTQSQDEIENTVTEEAQIAISPMPASLSSKAETERGFDWLAMGLVVLMAAFFAITARFHAQPATSLVPIAVLSATGVGLFITALRKIHPIRGPGVFEAGLGGFFVAIFQFLVAITYPGVFDTLATSSTQLQGFLNTWGLILVASIVFSIVGVALGNLAFAPPRPLPSRTKQSKEVGDVSVEDWQADQTDVEEDLLDEISEDEDDAAIEDEQDTETMDAATTDSSQASRSFLGYLIALLLLGLAPTLIGYIFSAAYSAVLSLNGFTLSPYPTLRLLSGLLAWQVPVSVSLNGSVGNYIIFSLLWYIPLFFGNPSLFDLQALEPLVFNGAALALLLLTLHKRDANTTGQPSQVSWKNFLLLEALLGLIIVLPADLWLLQGIKGILQLQTVAIPIRSLQVLNPLTFTLNLITGPLVCLVIGVLLRQMSKQRFSIDGQK